ncbi:hypothetical protein CEUSTIGMA_g2165.t1 [Chlamydomonas eustigma]|uniref:Glycerol-3-phosphate dehydrogenase n=1 Tax=Chlamydomonas eustigma TaxID=1157962 RepID=A0A250WV52_9CHLO|nr:hypothetical protein CEUSTIGMA_g2165.t1 [Chlamydomonas eustigma]|eukprot:GAX74717.1 hypothetical protein CEUSTIGMA_g2165.t1 [Chlamydomonas eustigma]
MLRGKLMLGSLIAGTGGLLLNSTNFNGTTAESSDLSNLSGPIPTRSQQLSRIRGSTRESPFDLFIIGGGATGAGCALDAATRGLKTVLIEREDFGSGTSSKSTKLVHGGVRYLEKAVFNLDLSQLKLVYEALHERLYFLRNASYLAHPLPILTPCYQWWEVPYYWAGLKAYDLVAGSTNLIMSKFIGATESLSLLPTLAAKSPINGSPLKGSVLYYDGQFDDSRMNVVLACSAAAAGAAVVNHVECKELIKNSEGQIIGARCFDHFAQEPVEVYAKVVVNAAGPFVDGVRKLSDPSAANTVMGSSGTHITLPEFYGSQTVGMIIPQTRDGRVLFMLPWQGCLIAGTTDEKCSISAHPHGTQDEVNFILESLSDILGLKVAPSDVQSVWTGIRPLASNPKAQDTQNIVRDHVIYTDDDGLITVTGGKWTTYRRMAKETVDAAISTGRLPRCERPCQTSHLKLRGAEKYSPTSYAQLSQQYQQIVDNHLPEATKRGPLLLSEPQVDSSVLRHLATSYGDRSSLILSIAKEKGLGKRLHPKHPVLEAEVAYCVKHEMCETVEDFLMRRTRLAFIDAAAALESVPSVVKIMSKECGWSGKREQNELQKASQCILHDFFVS